MKLHVDRAWDPAWDLAAGRSRMPGIFDARAMTDIFPARGSAFLAFVAAGQPLDMQDEIRRATQEGVSRRILGSNNVLLVEPWIRTSVLLRLNYVQSRLEEIDEVADIISSKPAAS